MQSSHTFAIGSAVFDEQNLVSAAGLVPVLELAEQTGSFAVDRRACRAAQQRVASGAVNPAGKLTTIIAGMMCGADSIDDVNLLRARRHPAGVRRGIRAPCSSAASGRDHHDRRNVMTDVDMLKGFLAGAHVDDAVFALRPDYRAMLLGRRTS